MTTQQFEQFHQARMTLQRQGFTVQRCRFNFALWTVTRFGQSRTCTWQDVVELATSDQEREQQETSV